MQLETAMVMVVGLVALASVRLILALVGRDFAADHPDVHVPRRDPADGDGAPQRVCRGTGRNSHLLYFPNRPKEAAAAPALHEPVTARSPLGVAPRSRTRSGLPMSPRQAS